MIDNKLVANISQRPQLVMSYAMEQAFTALVLPVMELRTWLTQQIESNPLLLIEHPQDIYLPLHEEILASAPVNETLMELHCHIPPSERSLAEYLLFDIDEQGVLVEPVEEIAKRFSLSKEEVYATIEKIRKILPPYLCAESTKEALLRKLLFTKSELANLFEDAYEDLLNKRYTAIMKRWNISFETLQRTIKSTLSLREEIAQKAHTIVPDIILKEYEGKFHIDTQQELLPSFQFNEAYIALAREERQFVRRFTAQAKWLTRIVSKRHKILQLATQEIANAYQMETTPTLKSKEVCQKLACHESTLARALSNKYIETPSGIFPLRHFFSGQTPFQIEQCLSEFVAKEQKDTPLSDDTLAQMLEKRGIPCARRTVAKYRNALGIPKASLRKMN